jgi:sugar-specific transcriptional regulator TrmB
VREDTGLIKLRCTRDTVERERVTNSLGAIGLSKMEAEVYIYVSSNPETTAGQITKNMRIARSKTYEALGKLTSLGLVSKISGGEINRYYSSGTSVLKGMYMQQMEEANRAMEYIMTMDTFRPTETNVRTVGGADGYKRLKEAFLADMEKGDEILIIGSPASIEERLLEYFGKFHQKRIAQGVRLRIIYNADVKKERIARADAWKHTKVRCLPRNNSPAWIEIYGNRVLIPLISDRIIAIAITDKAMATSFRNYFELLWKSTKKITKKTQ